LLDDDEFFCLELTAKQLKDLDLLNLTLDRDSEAVIIPIIIFLFHFLDDYDY
jgi:hypothetical protein